MGKVKRIDLDEFKIYDDIKTIVMEEIERIKGGVKGEEKDVRTLFTLTRIYAVLKDDYREDIKYGLLPKPDTLED